MRRSPARPVLLALTVLTVVLAFGVTTAFAHGGGGGKGLGVRGASSQALVNEAAEQLDLTAATLESAIVSAANARIDEAVGDGDVDADDAADLKERADENLRYAISVNRTRVVAANLGITTTRLNTAFRAARKALIVERIDEAVEDGDLEADEAAELREELDDADLPGYKSVGFGFGFGGRGNR